MPKGQLFLSLGVVALGVLFLIGAYMIPDAAGYSTVGPAAIPKVVGAVLLVLGAFLIYEVWRGGFRNHDEAAEAALPMDWQAFAWLSGGIIVYGLGIEKLGFVASSMLLFMATARAFGNRAWRTNLAISTLLALLIFVMFNHGLGLNLPKGIFGFF